jgi:tripartite-type tricarboxylate transporter receptor subunit TctC
VVPMLSMLRWVIAVALFAGMPLGAHAHDHASRPIRLIVAFAPGGTTDFVARLLAERASAAIRQSIVVENKPGANGAIAAEYVAKSEPDGTTLFFSTLGALAINPNLRTDLPYDPARAFAPIAMLVRNTTVLAVRPDLGVHSVAELIARAKEKPGAISMAVTGIGANSHLAMELFQSAAGVKFQLVPYRGAAQAMTDLLGNQVDGIFADAPVLLGQFSAGKLIALAVMSAARSDVLPSVPTLIELGLPDTIAENWQGVLAPAGTPHAVIARLNRAFVDAVNDPDIRRRLVENGVTVSASSPEAFANLITNETARWGKIIRDKGIKPAS